MKIVFFDGYCSLCNGVVDWLMRHDSHQRLRFASLQGETAKAMLPPDRLTGEPDTILYLRDGELFERSAAVLKILEELGGWWSMVGALSVVPQLLRDGVYRMTAANRYRVFGRRDTCRLPTPEEKDRLLP